jgi:hypothetical protein
VLELMKLVKIWFEEIHGITSREVVASELQLAIIQEPRFKEDKVWLLNLYNFNSLVLLFLLPSKNREEQKNYRDKVHMLKVVWTLYKFKKLRPSIVKAYFLL